MNEFSFKSNEEKNEFLEKRNERFAIIGTIITVSILTIMSIAFSVIEDLGLFQFNKFAVVISMISTVAFVVYFYIRNERKIVAEIMKTEVD